MREFLFVMIIIFLTSLYSCNSCKENVIVSKQEISLNYYNHAKYNGDILVSLDTMNITNIVPTLNFLAEELKLDYIFKVDTITNKSHVASSSESNVIPIHVNYKTDPCSYNKDYLEIPVAMVKDPVILLHEFTHYITNSINHVNKLIDLDSFVLKDCPMPKGCLNLMKSERIGIKPFSFLLAKVQSEFINNQKAFSSNMTCDSIGRHYYPIKILNAKIEQRTNCCDQLPDTLQIDLEQNYMRSQEYFKLLNDLRRRNLCLLSDEIDEVLLEELSKYNRGTQARMQADSVQLRFSKLKNLALLSLRESETKQFPIQLDSSIRVIHQFALVEVPVERADDKIFVEVMSAIVNEKLYLVKNNPLFDDEASFLTQFQGSKISKDEMKKIRVNSALYLELDKYYSNPKKK